MKNLLTKTKNGQHTQTINNSIGCNFQKEIKYDVYTELWEYDNDQDYIDILALTCNDNEDVCFVNGEYVILNNNERVKMITIIDTDNNKLEFTKTDLKDYEIEAMDRDLCNSLDLPQDRDFYQETGNDESSSIYILEDGDVYIYTY